jgi:hypothetical protein
MLTARHIALQAQAARQARQAREAAEARKAKQQASQARKAAQAKNKQKMQKLTQELGGYKQYIHNLEVELDAYNQPQTWHDWAASLQPQQQSFLHLVDDWTIS